MQKQRKIILDLDDSGYETLAEMHVLLDAVSAPYPKGEYLSPKNAGEPFTRIIEEAKFMLSCRPATGFVEFVRSIGDLAAVCTHRGYHPDGLSMTLTALERDGIVIADEHIHVIDPAVTPNKIQYLEEIYGTDFILVDDKPSFDQSIIDSRIVYYDRPWNQGRTGHRIFDWGSDSVQKVLALAKG